MHTLWGWVIWLSCFGATLIQIKRPGEQNNADWDYWEGLDGYLRLQKQIFYCSDFQTPLGNPAEVSVSLSALHNHTSPFHFSVCPTQIKQVCFHSHVASQRADKKTKQSCHKQLWDLSRALNSFRGKLYIWPLCCWALVIHLMLDLGDSSCY